MNLFNLRRSTLSTALTASLLASSTAIAQDAVGLDALSNDRLMQELATRGMTTLLDRAFEQNNVPRERQQGILTLIALRELGDPDKKITNRQREELIQQIVKGIETALPSITDPNTLWQQATTLITQGVERDVNTLEYWGENPRTQAMLRPIVETVIKLLDRTAELATAEADKVANSLRGVNDPNVRKWEQLDMLATNATYTKYMVDYYLALSIDAADPRRKQVADAAIEYLSQFDNPDSTIQSLVRNRLAKLHMIKADYAAAMKLFDSVASADAEIAPPPDAYQQYEARYFGIVSELLSGNLDNAGKELVELRAWQQSTLPQDAGVQQGVEAAAAMLDYRIASARAAAEKAPAEKKRHDEAAVAVLLGLLKDRPDLESIIFEQLMRSLPENADVSGLDTLLLRALVQKGDEERLKEEGDPVDTATLERAIAAAREMVKRKGSADADLVDAAAIRLPFFLQKLDRDIPAANAFIDYIEAFPENQQNARIALDNAGSILVQVRKNPETATTVEGLALYDRLLPVAIAPPFNRLDLAFEWARRLQELGRYKEAVDAYRKVPADDSRSLHARFFEMVALKQRLGDDVEQLDPGARQRIVAEIDKLADTVNRQANAALAAASTEDERLNYQSMLVRTALLAADVARRELKDPNRTLAVLDGFEASVKGLARENEMLGEALFLRVQAYMGLNETSKATDALVRLIEQGGEQGLAVVYNLLMKLNQDLDQARAANDIESMRVLAQNRAALSGFLVDWAEKHRDPNVKANAYSYAVFDAATKQLAANLETDPARKRQLTEETLRIFQALQARPEGANDPAVMLGLGLSHYALGNYEQARQNLGPLVAERKLGTAKKEITQDGETRLVDNDQYWEATFKLLHSNMMAAGDNAEVMASTKAYLGRLYVQWGDQVGGNNWRDEFESLRKELIPDLKVTPLSEITAQSQAPQ